MARSAEVGAIAEADATLLKLCMRVRKAERGDVEPRQETRLWTLAKNNARHRL